MVGFILLNQMSSLLTWISKNPVLWLYWLPFPISWRSHIASVLQHFQEEFVLVYSSNPEWLHVQSTMNKSPNNHNGNIDVKVYHCFYSEHWYLCPDVRWKFWHFLYNHFQPHDEVVFFSIYLWCLLKVKQAKFRFCHLTSAQHLLLLSFLPQLDSIWLSLFHL